MLIHYKVCSKKSGFLFNMCYSHGEFYYFFKENISYIKISTDRIKFCSMEGCYTYKSHYRSCNYSIENLRLLQKCLRKV